MARANNAATRLNHHVGPKSHHYIVYVIVYQVSHISPIRDKSDLFIWSLHNNDQFTVHSMYLHIINQNTPFSHKLIWKLKIPLKVKIFLWYLERGNFNKGQPN
jgi:hypothetical protein